MIVIQCDEARRVFISGSRRHGLLKAMNEEGLKATVARLYYSESDGL